MSNGITSAVQHVPLLCSAVVFQCWKFIKPLSDSSGIDSKDLTFPTLLVDYDADYHTDGFVAAFNSPTGGLRAVEISSGNCFRG